MRITALEQARDSNLAILDERCDQWRAIHEAGAIQLQEALAVATQALREADSAFQLAGDEADAPAKTEEEDADDDNRCDDGSDDGIGTDNDAEVNVDTTGDGVGMQVDTRSTAPPVFEVLPYSMPPARTTPTDPAVITRMRIARDVVAHSAQQDVPIPLSFSSIGLAPIEVRECVGDQVWLARFPDATEVPDSQLVPRGVLATLVYTLCPLRLDATSGSDQLTADARVRDAASRAAESRPRPPTKKTAPRSKGAAKPVRVNAKILK